MLRKKLSKLVEDFLAKTRLREMREEGLCVVVEKWDLEFWGCNEE